MVSTIWILFFHFIVFLAKCAMALSLFRLIETDSILLLSLIMSHLHNSVSRGLCTIWSYLHVILYVFCLQPSVRCIILNLSMTAHLSVIHIYITFILWILVTEYSPSPPYNIVGLSIYISHISNFFSLPFILEIPLSYGLVIS